MQRGFPPTAPFWAFVTGGALFTLGASGCSLLLTWDENLNPCDADFACFNGFSCLVDECVADGSRGEGETCDESRQCDQENNLICTPSGAADGIRFTCRKSCTTYFTTSSTCGSDNYCRPVINRKGQACNIDNDCPRGECVEVPGEPAPNNRFCQFFEGVCVPTDDCVADTFNGCAAGEICVELSSTANACLVHCEIVWVTSSYADTCGSSDAEPKYCQPVGAEGSVQLVCLDTRQNSAQLASSSCDPVDEPCAEGLACLGGICYRHCDARPGADAGDQWCGGNDIGRWTIHPDICCGHSTDNLNGGLPDSYGLCILGCP